MAFVATSGTSGAVGAPSAELVATELLLPTAVSPRQSPLDQRHVRALQEVLDQVPPIIVHRQTMTVVDGAHRLEAVKQAGCAEIRVVYFDGTALDAFVLGIQANATHGRPLTIEERKGAARMLLAQFPDRSTRWVAGVCGLSSATVARVRPRSGSPERRIGQDGRSRPVDPAGVRTAIAERLEAHPDASLRQVATEVGASPSTVRRIAEQRSRPQSKGDPPEGPLTRPTLVPEPFTRWLEATAISEGDGLDLVAGMPDSQLPSASAEFRRRAHFWTTLADAADARAPS